ncbi:MAG: hypothetical protein KAT65_23320, partial [Methanophagales archaeon]|nr:hypothetical protein [Methanophagales archaeon]
YSPRVIDIFKKNPDMWILLGCYGVSIFYGFIVLKLVEGEAVSQGAIWTLGSVTISFEFCVSLAYWLGAFTFVALFPYMLDVIRLLKPESIIKRLAVEITKDKILNSKEDPIQPIVDIIHGSIMKYDIVTTRIGLGAVTEQVIEIIDSDGEEKISECFRGHLTRASRLAISREDEESTAEVIKSLETFGKSAADKNLEYTTRKIIKSIELIGKITAKKAEDFDWVTWQAVESLNLVEKVAIGKGEKFENTTAETALSIGRVGIAAAENEREWPTDWAVLSLEDIGENAMKCGLARATNRAVFSLGIVVMTATRKGMTLGSITSQAKTIEFIEDVGKTAIDKGTEFKSVVKQAAESIEWIGTTAVERGKEFKSVAERAAVSIEEVGISAAEKGGEFEDATIQAVESLKLLGKIAAKNELEEAVCKTLESLAQIGRITAEKGLENVASQIAWSLINVGEIAAEKRLDAATSETAKSLAELTILSEEAVK